MAIRRTNNIREKRTEEITNKKYADLSKWYKTIDIYMNTFLNSKELHGLILEGEGGFGKSTIIEQYFIDNKIAYRKIKGHMTPLELYHKLVEYKDEIIFFDDCEGLFDNKSSVSILKGALETVEGTRTIQYNTTSPRLTANSEEVFKGKILFSCNFFPDNVNLRALKSRCFYEYVDLSLKDKLAIMTTIAELGGILSRANRLEVVKFISRFTSDAHIFNLRTQRVIEGLYTQCKKDGEDWTTVALRQLPVDDNLKAYFEVISKLKSAPVCTQVALFNREYGLSRRTFFNIKRKSAPFHNK